MEGLHELSKTFRSSDLIKNNVDLGSNGQHFSLFYINFRLFNPTHIEKFIILCLMLSHGTLYKRDLKS